LPLEIRDLDDLVQHVRRHISSLADTTYLLGLCGEFVQKERHDATYIWALDSLSSQATSGVTYETVGDRFLHDWNQAYYRDPKHRGFDSTLRSDLKEIRESCSAEMDALSQKVLGELNGDDISLSTKLFETFGQRRSIAWTGASKMLNVTLPHVFMIWDSSIRDSYHLLHEDHISGDYVACYSAFMKQSNQIAKEILEKVPEGKLAELHPTYALSKFKKTLAKMMDEANYMTFSWK